LGRRAADFDFREYTDEVKRLWRTNGAANLLFAAPINILTTGEHKGILMMIEAIIFDVDGTLVDTVDMHAEAWQRAFKEFGKDLEFQAVREQIGKGGDQLMPEFLSEKELKEFGEKLEEAAHGAFRHGILPKTKPFPKVRELCERIKKDGIKIVLASSATGDEVEFFKKAMNIADLLEAETTSDDAEASKPEPDIFEAALKRIGDPNASRCIVVGDTPYDAIAAGKINLKPSAFCRAVFPNRVCARRAASRFTKTRRICWRATTNRQSLRECRKRRASKNMQNQPNKQKQEADEDRDRKQSKQTALLLRN
jgi:HAD superfamily hydrolase (TIGR01509 family)